MVRLWAVLEVCCALGVEGCPPWVALFYGTRCIVFMACKLRLTAYSAIDIMRFTFCSGVGFWWSSSRRLLGPIYVLVGVRGLSLLCFRRDGSLISQAAGAALEPHLSSARTP